MKICLSAAVICLTAALFCGCSSRHTGPAYHAGDENPPDFLVGPVGNILTNFDGFSAHVVEAAPPVEGLSRNKSGELLERDGRFIFQPTLLLKGKRARTEGGLFFIWDEAQHGGYVLSDALQGYAPIKSDATAKNVTLNAFSKPGIEEVINGHPCHRREAAVPSDDGTETRIVLWEAEDEKHFPARLEWVNGPKRATLDFSEIRLEYPPQQLFQPPDGFTAYDTSVALMNELIVREARLVKKSSEEFDEPSDVRSHDWHQQTPGAPGIP